MTNATTMIADLGVIIAGGGSGSRFGGGNKLHALLDGRPVFTYALAAFAPWCPPEALILATPESEHAEFVRLARQYCPGLRFRLVGGGATRGRSVANGMAALPPEAAFAAIHDAARPLVSADLLQRCLADARRYGGAVAARPVTDTLKRVTAEGMIAATVDRSVLWAVETPQVFDLALLRQAYVRTAGQEFTDDAGVMEAAGMEVKLTMETAPNPKITYPGDLVLATALLQAGLA